MTRSAIYFYDDYWLEYKKSVKKRFFNPEHAGTYRRVGLYQSFHWCPEIDKYRMWFEVLPDWSIDARRVLALAESDDGVNWQDADIDKSQFPEDIYKHGSIVYMGGESGVHGTCVYRDPYEKDPSMIYKMCTNENIKTYGFKSDFERNIVVLTSPDGVRWDEKSRIVIYPFASDTYNCLTYNPIFNEYFLYFRASGVDRRVALMRSKDLINWSRPIIVLHTDSEDYDDSEFIEYYALFAEYTSGLFIGQLWRYHRKTDEKSGYMDTELVYSYNGINWFHTNRKSIVERPQPPAFGSVQLQILGMAESRNSREWIISASCSRAVHGSAKKNGDLYKKLNGEIINFNFYKIRKGGFCGLECCGNKGTVSTKLLQLMNDDLTFNISVPFGSVRFAISDNKGEFCEGFGFEDCIPYSGNDVEVRPQWGKGLSEIVGKRIKIWIEIHNGILFSINGSFRPFIHGPQVSLNDGARIEVDELLEGGNWSRL